MQIDMHYYGTYVLARTAGFNTRAARVIASASQYVDESIGPKRDCYLQDGSYMRRVVTGHHFSSTKNLVPEDQRFVWVPFHFLPGGRGNTFSEKLICIDNSQSHCFSKCYTSHKEFQVLSSCILCFPKLSPIICYRIGSRKARSFF